MQQFVSIVFPTVVIITCVRYRNHGGGRGESEQVKHCSSAFSPCLPLGLLSRRCERAQVAQLNGHRRAHATHRYPTRIVNSVSRDTCSDLTMALKVPPPKWLNSQEALSSDHYLIHTTITKGRHKTRDKSVQLVDWHAFRKTENFRFHQPPNPYDEWSRILIQLRKEVTREIKTKRETPAVDQHLPHFWYARRQLTRRWKRQKLNRKLKLRIAEVTAQAEKCHQTCKR